MEFTILQTLITIPNVIGFITTLGGVLVIFFAVNSNLDKKLKLKADKDAVEKEFSAVEKKIDIINEEMDNKVGQDTFNVIHEDIIFIKNWIITKGK